MLFNDVAQHTRHLQGSLPFGKVQQPSAQFEVHIDITKAGPLCHCLKDPRFPRARRGHDQHQPVIQYGCLIDLTRDLVGPSLDLHNLNPRSAV